MSRYTVVYLADAEEDLVSLWEESGNRNAIAAAVDAMDKTLGSAPISRSVFLGEGLWRADHAPLRFYFCVREDDRIVEVTNVVRLA